MRAVKITAPGIATLVSDVPEPRLRPSYVLVRPHAWAINPADHHLVHDFAEPGVTVGIDWSGVVLEVADNIKKFKPGDEVVGACYGGNNSEPEDGAFADIIVAKEGALFHKPKHLKWEEVAGFGSGIFTVGQTLTQTMKLDRNGAGKNVFIYGASSSTGTLAVQVAKLYGCNVIATCSPSNSELVKSRGADHVFDYRDPQCLDQIRRIAGDNIAYVVDCIGSEETAEFCAQVLSSEGGHYHSIKMPLPAAIKTKRPEDNVMATTALAYTLFGETIRFANGWTIEAVPEDYAFVLAWKDTVEDWLKKGLVKPHPPEVRPGGIEGIVAQIEAISTLGPSGKKAILVAQQ